MSLYKLIWDDFCSWLLELVKPEYGMPIDKITHDKVIVLFENNLRLLHPFMPFLTEELWHFISPRKENEALIVSSWPTSNTFDQETIDSFEYAKEVVASDSEFQKR